MSVYFVYDLSLTKRHESGLQSSCHDTIGKLNLRVDAMLKEDNIVQWMERLGKIRETGDFLFAWLY